MQALFILPLLISVLAMAISLFASLGPGAIIAADLPMFSPVQAIMAAEAGEQARAVRVTAISSFFIGNLVVETKPASCRREEYGTSLSRVSERRQFYKGFSGR